MQGLRLITAVCVLTALLGCGEMATSTTPAAGAKNTTLTISGGQHVRLQLQVQIASTVAERDRGLQGVPRLANDRGMVFAFPATTNQAFWMKDTLIPLDIAFWTSDGTIVDVKRMPPCQRDPCPYYKSQQPYIASVEVAGGLLERSGVRVGDTVTLDS